MVDNSRQIPHPHDDPEAWNSIILGGFIFPYKIAVDVDIQMERNLDQQESSGADNVTHNHQGFKPAVAKVNLRMWDSYEETLIARRARRKTHLEIYQDLVGYFRPGFPSKPVGVIHPQFTIARIKEMIIMKVVAPKHLGGGEWTGEIDLLEFEDPSKRKKGTEDFKIADGGLEAKDGADFAVKAPSTTPPGPK